MSAPVALAALWGVSVVAVAYIVWHDVVQPERRARRAEREHAAAERLIEMRRSASERARDLDDMQWAAVESQWNALVNSLPVLPYDPEKLGGAS